MSFPRKKFLETITYHEPDWDELQNNIGNYYDPILSTMQGQINEAITHKTTEDLINGLVKCNGAGAYSAVTDNSSNWNTAFGWGNHALAGYFIKISDTLDNILQGTTSKKLSAAEYAKFLTGFYDILDQTTTVKFGHNRNITSFYFAKGADADGANIYANDLFSRGYPVYVIVFASPWILIPAVDGTGPITHSLGFRPSFGLLQVSQSDPTGQPEDYVYTGDPGIYTAHPDYRNWAKWNNTYYDIQNNSDLDLYFRVLLFAYMGA